MAPHAPTVLPVIFDGLRPDLATPERAPALPAFLAGARVFPNASSVFPSTTRVCAAAIGTGAPPGVHGVVQNAWPEPELFPDRFLDTARADDLRRALAATGQRRCRPAGEARDTDARAASRLVGRRRFKSDRAAVREPERWWRHPGSIPHRHALRRGLSPSAPARRIDDSAIRRGRSGTCSAHGRQEWSCEATATTVSRWRTTARRAG